MDNKASYSVYLDMPREKIWEKLRDFTLAPNYVPGVDAVKITTEKKEGIGASRRILPKGMDETVVEWNEGYGFVLRLHSGDNGPPVPFKEARFRYAMEDAGNRTRFTMGLMYTMRMGGFGRFLDKLFMGKFIVTAVKDVAISLKHFFETGEPVTPAILKQLKKKI